MDWLYATPSVPGGRGLEVVIAIGGICAEIVMLKEVGPTLWGVGLQESVTVTEMDNVPVPVGDPESSPEGESVIPAGTPVADQTTGRIPPLELNWKEYAWFCVAAGSGDVLVSARAGQEIVVERDFVIVVEIASVTRAVNEVVPAVVGVPESNPPGDSVMPVGGVPEACDHT
jgi:hypothetical protein